MSTSSLLLIEDNPGDTRLLREMFADNPSHDMVMTQVGCMREAEAQDFLGGQARPGAAQRDARGRELPQALPQIGDDRNRFVHALP